MSSGIIYSEAEFSVAKNKLSQYLTFLTEKVGEYTAIMGKVETALDTELLQSNVSEISTKLATVKMQLEPIVDGLGAKIDKLGTALEEIDNFEYPEMQFNDIRALLISFL